MQSWKRPAGLMRVIRPAAACVLLTLAVLGTADSLVAQQLAADGSFAAPGFAAGEYLVSARQTIGPWNVDLGNVGLHVGQFAMPRVEQNAVDLNGNRSGSLFQTLKIGRAHV